MQAEFIVDCDVLISWAQMDELFDRHLEEREGEAASDAASDDEHLDK
jgi:hypothetical protein